MWSCEHVDYTVEIKSKVGINKTGLIEQMLYDSLALFKVHKLEDLSTFNWFVS